MVKTFTFKDADDKFQYSWMTGLPLTSPCPLDKDFIAKTDIAEYIRFYGFAIDEMPTQIDRSDIGYITRNGQYEKPSMTYRGEQLIEKLAIRPQGFFAQEYDGLEVTPCIVNEWDQKNNSLEVLGIAFESGTPHFWSLSGHSIKGGAETFFDFHSANDAMSAATAMDIHLKTEHGILFADIKRIIPHR